MTDHTQQTSPPDQPAIYVCLTHSHVVSSLTRSSGCEIAVYVPQADAESLEAQIVELRRVGNELADAAGIVLPSSDRYTGPERLLRISIDAFRALSTDQPEGE